MLPDRGEGLIYLDYQATTPVDPRIFEAMRPYFSEIFGNASSTHESFGRPASEAVERSRKHVAAVLGVSRQEIVFTSGATESNNLAIKGIAAGAPPGSHFVTCATEHKSVLDVFHALEGDGHRVTFLGVDREGRIDLNDLGAAIDQPTVLASLMVANNEIGTIQPVREAARMCRESGVLFHSDATQALGKLPLSLGDSDIDMASLSGHKIYAPKGTGALYVRRAIQNRLRPLLDGGGQERGLRSGTINVAGCVALGRACQILAEEGEAEAKKLLQLTSSAQRLLSKRVEGLALNGPRDERLPGNLNFRLPGVPGDALLASLPSVAISTGSACTSAVPSPSHVLKAIGLDDDAAECSVRLSVGRFTTEAEIEGAVALIAKAVERIRGLVTAP